MEIINSGIHTTIQDIGRVGYYHLGVPPSGAADQQSFMLGNILLGNPKGSAALEMKIKGCKIKFKKATYIVIAGAPAKVFLNGEQQKMWQVIKIDKEDILEIKELTKGIFTYLCLSGGIRSQVVLGSQSTCLASDFPGLNGRRLLEGDELEIANPLPGVENTVGKELIKEALPQFKKEITLRIILGITEDLVDDEGIVSLLNDVWLIQTDSNKVAYRLEGGKLTYKDKKPPFGAGSVQGNIVDIPYPIGAVIIPNEKEMIILLNDGTGGGGFVTVGAIIWSDLSRLSQMKPLSKVKFEAITIDQAMTIKESEAALIKKAEQSIDY